ncbi:hypothetical protein PC129_g14326 [Phytophthora cactorum]|uniref:Integrase catalytic domain-containing protein n=2 Tax=Phytophthora cactorum TaxID=29920 RepID=A0A8T1HQR1_9STRA|nr:hypothetical protein PC111_g8122 [Phytophthora cactorum]KAG3002423.1 hypothetical protein PC119_g16335 [Phytophthora cactorum]KAG3214770.1 hypothetical protein PC129_g14326 [Phytophthora cactorum]
MSFVRWSGDEAADDRTSIGMVLSSEDAGQCDECMIDTGAGVHVCTNWSAFTSLQEDTMSFVGWRGETSRSEAFGDVKVCATDAMSGSDVILDLVDTRYASNGVSNLLSLEQLELGGWVPFYTKAVKPADRKMHLDRGSQRMCMMAVADRQSAVMRWHMNYAHLNGQALKQLVLKDMAMGLEGLKASDFDKPLNCISCQMTKQKRRSYKRHDKCSKLCYERLMSDVCYVGLETTGGNRYFQLVQDEASRFKWCFLLRTKDEAAQNVMDLILQLEKYNAIKRFSCDQGKEFINKKLMRFLVEHGIQLLTTNTYTPEENCLVEKLNGSLLNKARAIRQATVLPAALWGEILLYVVEVNNMSPTKALTGTTPFTMITGNKPDV